MGQLLKLPNLGNTCYINTALQVLLINKVLKQKLHFYKDNLNQYSKLLLCLYNSSDDSKQTIIKMIMKELELKNEQGDSHEVLLKMIEILETNSISILNDEYTLKYSLESLKCIKCGTDKNIKYFDILSWVSYTEFIDINKPTIKKTCDKCDKVLDKTIRIINYPRYLIFYPLSKSLHLEININDNIKYKLKMLNVFIGLDNIGHYYNIYRSSGKWVKIDDDTITKISDIKEILCNKMLRITSIIYKKV